VLYEGFFEWFSYQDNYDVSRIVTMNVDYIVLKKDREDRKMPDYLNSSFFEKVREDSCEDIKGKGTHNTAVFRIADRDGFARNLGLGEKAELRIAGGGRPVQAMVFIEGADIQYKSKRDGSLTVYFPAAGNYTLHILRPGFRPKTIGIEAPSGEILINLERDSPFITHTTSNRY
jgi:hypothetical protein